MKRIIELSDIVVTGMSAVTAFGNIDQSVKAMLEGRSAISSLLDYDSDFAQCPTTIGGVIKNFSLTDYGFTDREAKRLMKRTTRPTQFACAAVRDALIRAGLADNNFYPQGRCGASIGTGIGSSELIAKLGADMLLLQRNEITFDNFTEEHLGDIVKVLPDASAYQSQKFKGPMDCSIKACATGLGNIRRAMLEIYLGFADMRLAGATESLSPVDVMPFNIYARHGALSRRNHEPEKASCPWNDKHDGFVPAEGAGIFVLEREEKALARGAPILARVIGFGETTDGSGSTTDPSREGQVEAMRMAFEWAGLSPQETLGKIAIIAHATSTPAGDGVELMAIREVFGDTRQIYITAPKSMLGHTLAPSGVIQAGTAILAARMGKIMPTINLEYPIPEAVLCNKDHAHSFEESCYLNLVPNCAVSAKVRYILCNSFGFGGQNVCILFEIV